MIVNRKEVKGMERRTARISKEPEVRRQEILDTAMKVFMEKGYEAATMRDIAAAMHVVPGLCYRYFESKQSLYDAVVQQYVRDITAPMIQVLEEEDDTLDGFLDRMQGLFCEMDGREKYHLFFHKKENHSLHQLLSADLCETLKPYMEKKLYKMKEKGLTDAACIPMAASFLLYGASPVILDDGYSTEDKADGIRGFMERVLKSR